MKGIKFKSSKGNNYFYDDLTGLIYYIDENNSTKNISKKYSTLTKDTRLSKIRNNICANTKSILKYLFSEANGFKQLLIETTSQCNLRCKYCVFSDFYPYTKSHSNTYMDYETAKKSVDYYFNNFKNINYRNPTRVPVIGFYGGEPLLNFKLIKEIVEYINSTYTDYDEIQYNITTNGILLKDDILDFLVENNFAIVVSLDGYKENHDRNRVKPNGQGSFDEAFNNIINLKTKYPDYLKFGISACYDVRSDFQKYMEFFDKEKLFIAKLSPIDPNNSTYYDQFSDEEKIKHAQSYEKLKNLFLQQAKCDCIDKESFLYTVIGISYSEFALHPVLHEVRPEFFPFTSCCIPGDKIYVTVDGNYHVCEKINTNHPIGNVNTGLNYDKICDMINDYKKSICKSCCECNVTRFCSLCFQHCATDEGFIKPHNACKKLENRIKSMLESFIDVLEVKPDLFDNITVDYYSSIYEMVGNILE